MLVMQALGERLPRRLLALAGFWLEPPEAGVVRQRVRAGLRGLGLAGRPLLPDDAVHLPGTFPYHAATSTASASISTAA